LLINGLKMSKTLKNFITIRQALKTYTPRQLRLLFLIKPWDKPMNYVEETMEKEVKSKEKTLVEFFSSIKTVLKEESQVINFHQKWTEEDQKLHKFLQTIEETVDNALKDNFNTPVAIQALLDLVSKSNSYINDNKEVKHLLLKKIALYTTKMLKVFGLIDADTVGFGSIEVQQGSLEAIAGPYIEPLLSFRQQVRDAAKTTKQQEILALSDKLRDEILPPLGLKLTDTPQGRSNWTFVDPENLMKEIADKKANILKEAISKLQSKLTKINSDLQKYDTAKIPPTEFFSKKEYSQFDNRGIPTQLQMEIKLLLMHQRSWRRL